MVSAAVKALSLMCDDGDVEKALLFGSSYSLDELESGEGNGGKPSSSRNFHASTQLCTAHPWHESSEVTATDPGDLPTATPALAGCLQGELLHLDLIVVEHAKTERPCDLDMLDLAVQELAGIVGLR